MTDDRTATVNAYFEAFGAREPDRLVSFFAADASWVVPGDPALTPWAGDRSGPQDIRQFFELFFEAAEPLAFEVHSFTEVGDDQVLITGRFAYRFHASGLEFDDEFVQRYTIGDGKITAFRIFEDSLGLARAYRGEPVIAAGA
jgi:ketosteroid isomerase-like protein